MHPEVVRLNLNRLKLGYKSQIRVDKQRGSNYEDRLQNEKKQCMRRVEVSRRKEVWRKPLIQYPHVHRGFLFDVHDY